MSAIKKVLLTVLLFSSFSAYAQEQELPFSINADSFSYSENGERLIAEGTVYVFSEDASLKTDKLIFDQKTNRIWAIGNVVMLDSSLNTTYTDQLELTGDFKRGVAKKMIFMVEDSTALITSTKAVKVNESKLNLENVVYSSCPIRTADQRLPWKITAKKVTYNKDKEYIIYRNAVFNLFDIPVMYMPMFYHSTNPDKPISGFLNPGFASSSTDGFGLKGGYFWAIDRNQDATIRATYLAKRGTILGLEHRYIGESLDSKVSIEGLEDEKYDKHARGLFEAEVEYVFDEGKRAGFNSVLTSDEDYLDEFKDDSDSYKYSTIYAEKANEKEYLGVSSRYFIDMRDDIDDEKLAQPVGRLQYERLFDIDENGGQFKFNSDVLALVRQDGGDTNRAVAELEYIKPFYALDGSLFEFTASGRGDYYSFNEDNNQGTQTESRFLPEASLSWEKPFVSSSFKHIITPKVMFITSPEEDFDYVPNEDSTSFELDSTNLFEKNRFSGYDRVETGNRVVYGIDTKYGDANLLNLQAFIGQSYNFSDKEEDLGSDTTSSNKNSDWVGFIKFEPTDYLLGGTNFRLDSSSFASQRVDSFIMLRRESPYSADGVVLDKDYIRLTHSFLKNDSEEINVYALYNLNDDIALKARVQRNMYDNITLLQELETIYKSCCYNLSFKVRKKQSEDEDEDTSSLDFLVNFSILPMGRK
jgi:LPS-assembly protein